MNILVAIIHWFGTPFRVLGRMGRFLVDLTPQQLKSVFSLGMLGGMIALSWHNVWYTYRAEAAVAKGEVYKPLFALLSDQIRFNSYLVAWFALIMGLVVFGADYFRAKWGDKEAGFGRGNGGV
jgi:hypothetical protein